MTVPSDMSAQICAALTALPDDVAAALREARRAILRIALQTDGVGPLTETLKWGEPAFLTETPKTGTTLRLGRINGRAAVMVPCSTTIIEDARQRFGDVPHLSGKRGVILGEDEELVEYVIASALTYHIRKRIRV
ncbi:DUF1801 domain-containing protein [uncultured Litoreibacter sp.]|uniref:DUF1801 domain-containing protein n=1 Tax=uncultured Litoreibacter sp. TaxID=1392394 RepID=UPI00262972C6|nr:DUF1801 domain-containing protein [uncultured Litoreibacter sp.]